MAVAPCEVCENVDFRHLFYKDGFPYQVCKHCGLIRIYPQLTDAELDAIYHKGYYEQWGGEEAVFSDMKRKTFSALLDRLPPCTPWGRLLDIGAATGILMEVAKERGYDVYGVEASQDGSAAVAEKFGPDRISNAYFNEHFAAWPPSFFNVICMVDLLEHVRRPDQTLRHVFSLLRPGGLLLLYLPDAGSLSRHIAGKYWPHFIPGHLFSFSRQNISRLLRQSGFTVYHVGSAAKYLTAEYAAFVFSSYQNPIYKIPARILRLLPERLAKTPIPVKIGQMALVAQRDK